MKVEKRTIRLVALVALLAGLTAAPSPAATVEDVGGAWLRVGGAGGGLEVVAAPVVLEFAGHGGLRFSADRRHIGLDGAARITVDGEAAPAGRSVAAGEVVEVRDEAGATHWRIRRIADAGRALAGEGTRIRDERPQDEARVDTREPTRFYLQLDPEGGSLFFHPEGDG